MSKEPYKSNIPTVQEKDNGLILGKCYIGKVKICDFQGNSIVKVNGYPVYITHGKKYLWKNTPIKVRPVRKQKNEPNSFYYGEEV